MKYLIIFLLMITGCSSGGSDTETTIVIQTEPLKIETSVVMYCDSMGALTLPSGQTWLDKLGELAYVDVYHHCIPGISIRDYPIEDMISELGIDHKYAIVALGVNDHNFNMIETLNIYDEYLHRIDETNMEAVCFLYPVTAAPSLLVLELNDGIKSLCNNRKIIISGTQISDYIHYSPAGIMTTAENAWRTLYYLNH